MSRRPRLSVVVPNYNHGKYLPRCLDSLLAQSVPPDEIWIVDDGSTDDSRFVIESFMARDPRIRAHWHPKNRGVVAAMNCGLGLARGRAEYLHFAGADDFVLPGLFEKSLDLLAKHPQAALSCTVSRWTDTSNGLTWLMGAGVAERAAYVSPDDLVGLEQAGRLMIVSHSALLRADAIEEFGGAFPERLRWHCDWFMTYAPAFRHGLCFIPEVLSSVELHGTSYYGAGHRRREHDEVMENLLALLHEDRFRDVGERVRASGALALHSTPMLRAMWRNPAHRDFLTARFVRKCLRRRAQLVARRHFPTWLARLCVRLFLNQRMS